MNSNVHHLAGTRTSHRWSEMPGNWDKLNCRAVYPASNPWGIPDLPAADLVPSALVAYSSRSACASAPSGAAVHFFLDDYRFEAVWTLPVRSLGRVQSVGAALTPDFSLWRSMPLAMQVWQVYRSRWCGAWMADHGVSVVPTVSWSTPRTYEFAFAGIPRGSVVALSTVGVHGPAAWGLFEAGYAAMLEAVAPRLVLGYGTGPRTEQVFTAAPVPVHRYPTRWDGR